MTTAALYCRISQDRDGLALGVQRQREDCTALAQRRGWTIGDEFVDNDVSAYSGKERPAYRRLLDALKNGDVDAVIAWHPDRLHRSPRELEDFIDVLEATGAQVATCTAGDIDLATADGRLMARIVGSVARKESEDKSRRLRRKHVELAEAGKIGGGGRRPFGFESDRVTVREDEARLIRHAARRIIAGDSIRSIVAEWKREGVRSVTGAEWSPTTVKRLLRSGRISGQREHNGTIVGPAVWPAIIDPADTARLRAILDDQARNRLTGRAPRSYLLTGFVRCGRCDERPMTTRPTAAGKPRYICATDRGGCGRCGISATDVEDLVVEAVFAALDTPDVARALDAETDQADADTLATLAADEEALAELSHDYYVARTITRPEFMSARQPLEARIAEARKAVADTHRASAADQYAGAADRLRAEWPAMSLDQRRAIIREVVDRVVIAPTTKANNRFDADRVNVVWRV